jgi:hypothetical protein
MTTHNEVMKRLGEAIEDVDLAGLSRHDAQTQLRAAFAALEDFESIRRARLHGMLTGLLNRVDGFKEDLRVLIRCIDGKDESDGLG